MRHSLVFATLFGAGCLLPTSSGFNSDDASSFATLITNGLIDAMNHSTQARGLKTESTGQIYVSLEFTTYCDGGGRITNVGSESGSYNTDTGITSLFLQDDESIIDCRMNGMLLEGDPYLSDTGTVILHGSQATTNSFSLGGGFTYDGHSLQVNLSLLLPTVTNSESHLSGYIGSYSIDESW